MLPRDNSSGEHSLVLSQGLDIYMYSCTLAVKLAAAFLPLPPTEFLLKLEPILRTPLPRVWDAVEGGLAEPTRATVSHQHAHTVGGDVSIAGMEEARSEFNTRLRGHIIRPLEQWSEGLSAVEVGACAMFIVCVWSISSTGAATAAAATAALNGGRDCRLWRWL